ncbi:MAG: bifunctional phosphopantothenoylcysteine decarboxylase/phosphopantothenate--cysteine ligase CoaBC, partial [Vampirovibrionia bacterium]
ITPLTLSNLSKNKVHLDMFYKPEEFSIEHISLADSADFMLIAPATANILGKVANGIADDLLSTTIMAVKSPICFAPAMNSNMWSNSIVQNNINVLKSYGYTFINPDEGELACGYNGEGRLRDVSQIFEFVKASFNDDKPLKGKKILITVGPTREYIDPVRFISNKSSGKMGIAIAKNAVELGAEVIVISSVPVNGIKASVINVESTSQMLEQLNNNFSSTDVLIMAAAVSDYTVKSYSDKKLKKDPSIDQITLELQKTPDLLATMASKKRNGQLIIGFAAETDDLIANAKNKLTSKNLDMIVANDVSRDDIGMGSDNNEVTFLCADGSSDFISKTSKNEIAKALMERIIQLL